MTKPIETTDRLRHEIDAGNAGDKVIFPDPAAAPLGTDDEAAGTPPSEAAIRRAAEAEVRQTGIDAPAVSDERGRSVSGEGRGLASANIRPVLVALAAVFALALVAAVILL